MSAVYAQPLTPELALVCPELRAQSLSSLPDIDPDALFRRTARAPAPVTAAPAPVILAALAYAASGFVGSVIRGLVTVATVAAIALVLTLAG